jgi:hypothetical protein
MTEEARAPRDHRPPPVPEEVASLPQVADESSVLRTARRIAVAGLGFTVLALGVALVVLPGPALVVIPAGLAILALEFQWARRWLRRVRGYARQAARAAGLGRRTAEPSERS